MSVWRPILGLDRRRIEKWSQGKSRYGAIPTINNKITNGHEFCKSLKKPSSNCKLPPEAKKLVDRSPIAYDLQSAGRSGGGGHLLGKERQEKKTRQGWFAERSANHPGCRFVPDRLLGPVLEGERLFDRRAKLSSKLALLYLKNIQTQI